MQRWLARMADTLWSATRKYGAMLRWPNGCSACVVAQCLLPRSCKMVMRSWSDGQPCGSYPDNELIFPRINMCILPTIRRALFGAAITCLWAFPAVCQDDLANTELDIAGGVQLLDCSALSKFPCFRVMANYPPGLTLRQDWIH